MKPETSDRKFLIREYGVGGTTTREDSVAIEEPMEIRVVFGPTDKRVMRSLSVTMRTPGHDDELAYGFLFTEGLIRSPGEIEAIEFSGTSAEGEEHGNTARVIFRPDISIDFAKLQRNFFTHSSCGVCGKSSLESLENKGVLPIPQHDFHVDRETIFGLPEKLRSGQSVFAATGGIHAAGFADSSGQIIAVREDVGRHNAVDKLIGSFFRTGLIPASKLIMIVSGRASFEIVQKGVVAGVPMMVAVGAPSSLAVELATNYNMTLVGFTSNKRFNVYADQNGIIN